MEQKVTTNLSIRPLLETDLSAADGILRRAFDSFTGATNLFGDRDYVHTRWRADPERALAAEMDGQLVGSNFVTLWGRLGFFGPLSVEPSWWDRGIAKGLMEITMDLFTASGTEYTSLFTFPQSPKHLGLYRKFGFWPRFLTPILQWPAVAQSQSLDGIQRYSELDEPDRAAALQDCRELTDSVLDGLDLTREIHTVHEQGLGDTLLLHGDRLDGFAICHAGPGTEAGSDLCYVKFAMLRPGLGDPSFDRLLDGCAALALKLGATRVEAGVNLACRGASQRLHERCARADGLVGIAMHGSNLPAYNRPDVYVLSDWR